MKREPSAESITNRLLDRLSEKDREQVLSACRNVALTFGDVIAEKGATTRSVYFPTSGFISVVAPMDGKDALEVALTGNEGFYGVQVALGFPISPARALVQGTGSAWRMGATAFRTKLARLPRFRHYIDRFIHVRMSQLMQTAGCNRFHVVEQRVARWLLMTSDRSHSPTFRMTHEFLAFMLGVRRVGITEAAGALQDRKLIRYSRGLVTILDRKGLESASCSCYRSDGESYARALG